MPASPRRRPAKLPATLERNARLDALRGLALLWMTAFHFCFDLAWFRLANWNFYTDPRWTVQRTLIVSLFLLVAGLAQGLAGPRSAAAFWRRWGQIAGCAALVTIASWFAFPQSFIHFGVLHGIALMTLLLRPLLPLKIADRWWLLAGAAALALPWLIAHPLFDSRWLNWVGLVTAKPITEDYLPLFPWLGVMLWGVALARWSARQSPALLTGPLPATLRPLAAIGRWSLIWYMLHQPLLLGSLLLLTR